jgi:hypothetical protein
MPCSYNINFEGDKKAVPKENLCKDVIVWAKKKMNG